MKGGSGCRLTEQYFRLERKSCREWVSGIHCMRRYVTDNEELVEMDASKLHAKDVETSHSQSKMEQSNIFGERTASENFHLHPGSFGRRRRTNFSTKSLELHSSTPLQEDSTVDVQDAENDFWTITREFMYLHHVDP